MKKLLLLCLLVVFAQAAFAAAAKNVIWIIGDGMGPGAMGFFMEGVRNTDLAAYPDKKSHLEKFINESVTGMYFNNTYDTIVTDSAASATQMAGGAYSRPETIGLDYNGKRLETIMERALKEGKSVGVVTDSYVADATPAAFLAHAQTRGEKYEIARQLVHSGATVVMGGGLKYFTGKDNKNLLKEAKKEGWTVVTDLKQLSKVKKGRVLGLFAPEATPFYVEKNLHPTVPTLLQMTEKAVELLSKNPNGFFLMVEAGKVDWALHDNEAGASFYEMLNLDETLAYAYDFAKTSGDTLLYLNADHETGMPGFHYTHVDKDDHKSAKGEMLYGGDTNYVGYQAFANLLLQKRMLYNTFADFKKLPKDQQTLEKLQQVVDETFGMHIDISDFDDPFEYDDLLKQINQTQNIVWATGSHSSGMLLGVQYGPRDADFSGVYHNTDLKAKFERALGFAPVKP